MVKTGKEEPNEPVIWFHVSNCFLNPFTDQDGDNLWLA